MLDMHSPGHAERESYFVVKADTQSDHREELRTIWRAQNAFLAAYGMQDVQFHEDPTGANTSSQEGMTSAQFVHARGINGCTFECTYQGERNHGRAYTIEDYQRMGASMVRAIDSVFST